MTLLDDLDRLARAASHAHYVAAISPDTILRLLAVVKAAKAIDYEMFNGMTPSVGSANKLKSAIAALEGDK
jgi:hypothetical protein